MKKTSLLLLLLAFAFGCNASKNHDTRISETTHAKTNDNFKISGDALDYDVIIIEPGFSTYLASTAKPEGFYSKSYLENKNRRYVQEWNTRVSMPSKYSSNLYAMQINYLQGVDYGYTVNYKMYNYFIYFQNKYNQNLLGSRVPQN